MESIKFNKLENIKRKETDSEQTSGYPVSIRRSRVWIWGDWGRFCEPSSLLSLYHFPGHIEEVPSFFAFFNSCEGPRAAAADKEGSPSGNGTFMKKGHSMLNLWLTQSRHLRETM